MTVPQAILRQLLAGERLDIAAAEALFDTFVRGEASEVQMAVVLTVLCLRGETPDEVAGGVRSLRKAMVRLDSSEPDLVDTCGTGGGAITTFNISTAASLVAVGGGVKIAKHGNRSFTSKCGGADVLEALGVPLELPPADERRMLEETGFVFMFAPVHHPAMRHIAPVRSALAVTTIMNLLGPLTNPAGVRRQVVGVARPEMQSLVAEAIRLLGHERALVVHGEPGMDELSPLGPTRVFRLDEGALSEFTVRPSDFGWPEWDPSELAGGVPAENARQVEGVIRGELAGAARASVILNAAAAFWVAGKVDTLATGVEAARHSIDSGRAGRVLDRLRAFRPQAPISTV